MPATLDKDGDIIIPKEGNAPQLFMEWLDLTSNEGHIQTIDSRYDSSSFCVTMDLTEDECKNACYYINAGLNS